LFKSETVLANHLGISEEKAKGLTIDLHIEINEINEHIPHELNQELFDKYTREEGKITSKKELEEEIKKQAEEQFKQHGEQQLFNDISEYLIENIKFDLPVEFLQKWIKLSAEKELTDEEAKAEYEKSEKGIRYQLIEAKIIKEHDIKVQPEEVKELMKNRIRLQMAQYGVTTFTDEQIEEFSNQMLSNEDEVRKVSEQVLSDKILALLKENLKLKEKEVSFKEFADENYK
jgi:trigger factor